MPYIYLLNQMYYIRHKYDTSVPSWGALGGNSACYAPLLYLYQIYLRAEFLLIPSSAFMAPRTK